jgi:hypothetical protein
MPPKKRNSQLKMARLTKKSRNENNEDEYEDETKKISDINNIIDEESDKLDDIDNNGEWGNDDDSGWEEEDEMGQEQRIFENLIDKPLELVWTNDAQLEKKKRGKYSV